MTSSHRSFTVHGKSFEDLMGISSNIMAYRNHRTVDVGYTRIVSQGIHLQKKHKADGYKFHGDRSVSDLYSDLDGTKLESS